MKTQNTKRANHKQRIPIPQRKETESMMFLIQNKNNNRKRKQKPRLAAGEAVEKERNWTVYLGILHCCLMHPRVSFGWFSCETNQKKNTDNNNNNNRKKWRNDGSLFLFFLSSSSHSVGGSCMCLLGSEGEWPDCPPRNNNTFYHVAITNCNTGAGPAVRFSCFIFFQSGPPCSAMLHHLHLRLLTWIHPSN